MKIAWERVDAAFVDQLRRIGIGFFRRVMIVFGLISSA
jgi:hypothetical protein